MKNAEASNFMLFGPGERKITPEQFSKLIESIQQKDTSALFVAEMEKCIVGYMIVQGESSSRVAHRASIVIGIHQDVRGKGIGTALFQHAEQWAKKCQIHRLELTVMKNNVAAIPLYQKMGFDIEGTKRDSLLVDGQYIDEFYMSKLI